MTTGAVTGLLVLAGLRVETIVALLAQVASFSFLVTYGLVHVAVVVFRRADPEEYDPAFEIPEVLYPGVPVVGVAMAAIVISQMQTTVILVGTGVVLFGVVWYVTYAQGHGVEGGLFNEAFGGVIRDVKTTVPGTTRPRTSGSPYRVVVGVANPATQPGLLRLAAATARAHGDEAELVAVNVIEAESAPERNIESDRLEHQRALLENARKHATETDVTLRTNAIIAEDAGKALVDIIHEESADQALLGWQGELEQADRVFGSTLDTVITDAPCDVSLVRIQNEAIGRPVALAGPGPHAPVAARRAADFATVSDSVATLLNVQQRMSRTSSEPNQVEQGRATIDSVAEQAGLERKEYETVVVVASDVEEAILQGIQEYDTVCVGFSEKSALSRAKFGSLAERISRDTTGNVGIVRSAESIEPASEDDDQ
jgi:nucleotide-binding universal stress UspA family protein